MGDLISRQTAIETFSHIKYNVQMMDDTQSADKTILGVQLAENAIKRLPSTQPETCAYLDRESNICALHRPSAQSERKSGEWEEIEVIADAYDISGVKTWASKMKCNQCGFTTIAIEGRFSQYNFCPSCGAIMDGRRK